MNKCLCTSVLWAVIALSSVVTVSAQQVPAIEQAPAMQQSPAIKQVPMRQAGYVSKSLTALPVLSDDTIKLDAKQQKGVSLADQWKDKSTLPFMGEDGSVQFIFGATLPSVVCAPLYACDVAMQPGEVIRQVMLGDASRWKVSPGTSGTGENSVAHVVVKPSDAGLSTNLVIHTDRRSYNIRLISKKDQWMPLVSFTYPDDTQAQWAVYAERQQQVKPRATAMAVPPRDNDNLNFNYRIKGDSPSWKPIRVYSDKSKTYIQFPATLKYDRTPALVILDAANQQQLVNYRMSNDRFVVDQIIDRAALISGVGRHQQRIEIAREGAQL
jgi:type IV secretion system protein TrbG